MKQKLTKIAPYLGMVVSATLVTTLTYGVVNNRRIKTSIW